MSDTELNDGTICYDETSEPRKRVPSERESDLGYKSEKINQLFKSRAGYISVLTRVYKEISDSITCGKCNVGDISVQLERFHKA